MEQALEQWGGRGNPNAPQFRDGWRARMAGAPSTPPDEAWGAIAYRAGYQAAAR